jgi:cleavage and polyadenylation specificity factor subunit 1
MVGEPFERIEIDIFGPLPLTKSGNKYILTMCDCFTKWTEAIPLADQTASTIAKEFVGNFISRFGCPLQVHSDRGSNFESQNFHGICKPLNTGKTRTTAQRPQSNGNIERFHRTFAPI